MNSVPREILQGIPELLKKRSKFDPELFYRVAPTPTDFRVPKKLYCEKNPIQTQRMGFYMHAWLQCMKTIIKYWLLDCVIFNFTWGIEMKVEVCYTKSRKY